VERRRGGDETTTIVGMSTTLYDFTRQDRSGASCTAQAWAQVPAPLSPAARQALKARAAALLHEHQAVLVAHYYVDGDLQDLALETGGWSPIRWKWRASAATMRPRRWWWPACASWANRPRS
jgi:hypothetical protein